MTAITLDNISKTYDKGKVLAVDKATFSVEEGEMFGPRRRRQNQYLSHAHHAPSARRWKRHCGWF